MRSSAFEIGKFANAVWEALDDEVRDRLSPFDWEVIPALLGMIDFADLTMMAPTIETAIAGIRAKATPPGAECAGRADTRIQAPAQ